MPFEYEHGIGELGSLNLIPNIKISVQLNQPTNPNKGDIWIPESSTTGVSFRPNNQTPSITKGDIWVVIKNTEIGFNLEKAFSAYNNDKQVIMDYDNKQIKTSFTSNNIKILKNKFLEVWSSFINCKMYKNGWVSVVARYWDGVKWVDFGYEEYNIYTWGGSSDSTAFNKFDQKGNVLWKSGNHDSEIRDICLDRNGNIYYCYNNMVNMLNPNMELVYSRYPGAGSILKLASDTDGVYAGDNVYRVYKLSNDGILKTLWTDIGLNNAVSTISLYNSEFILAADVGGGIRKMNRKNGGGNWVSTELTRPIGVINADKNGYIYTLTTNGLQKFQDGLQSPRWTYDKARGKRILMDSEENIYTVTHTGKLSPGQSGILKISTSGIEQYNILGKSNDSSYIDITLDRFGYLYVLGEYQDASLQGGKKRFIRRYNAKDGSGEVILFETDKGTKDSLKDNFIIEKTPYKLFDDIW